MCAGTGASGTQSAVEPTAASALAMAKLTRLNEGAQGMRVLVE
jgi:hypothetical protein